MNSPLLAIYRQYSHTSSFEQEVKLSDSPDILERLSKKPFSYPDILSASQEILWYDNCFCLNTFSKVVESSILLIIWIKLEV